MKAALDVYYQKDWTAAAAVVFEDWEDTVPVRLARTVVPTSKDYQAGKFFRRELPGLLAVLQEAGQPFDALVIDGFVHLRPDAGKGLGVHLSEALPYRVPIIGVAKSPLKVADRFVPVLRGRSKKPLYVSAIGYSLERAASVIQKMHGPFRIPTLLRLVDQHTRDR